MISQCPPASCRTYISRLSVRLRMTGLKRLIVGYIRTKQPWLLEITFVIQISFFEVRLEGKIIVALNM